MQDKDNNSFIYDAFISYRHVMPDKIIAERLHRLLETYRVPKYLAKKGAPRRLKRIFLDSSELPTDSNLSESIQRNLEASRFLIVVCSPRTLESRWVMREVETFIKLGRRDKILTLLIEGEPSDSFPHMLRFVKQTFSGEEGSEQIEYTEEIEPLAADIRADSVRGSIRKLSVEKLRLLAPIIGCSFDDLRQRHKRSQTQQRIACVAVSICLLIAVSVFGFWMQEKKALEKDRLNVAAEVMNNIVSLDNRLTFVYQTIELKDHNDVFSCQLSQIRNSVAPALNETADIRYQQLQMNQLIGSLQQAINTSSLRTDYGDVLGKAILHSGINQQDIRVFYDYLKIVDQKTNSFMETMSDIADQNPDDQEYYIYNQDKLSLELALLKNRSELAYIYGLKLFNEFGEVLPAEYSENISHLKNLTPMNLADNNQLQIEEAMLLNEGADLIKERQRLVETISKLTQEKLTEYQELNNLLVIRPDDNSGQVAAKAKSLRQLGRIEESITAYKKYEEMFSAEDPTAPIYAETGCLFAVQAKNLGIDGGAFVFLVKSGSAADAAGIKKGDIIIYYGKTAISEPEVLKQTIQEKSGDTVVQLNYLRKNQQGVLEKHQVEVPAGILGVGMNPI